MRKYFGHEVLEQLEKALEMAKAIKADCQSENHAPQLEDSWKEIIDKYDRVINLIEEAKAEMTKD